MDLFLVSLVLGFFPFPTLREIEKECNAPYKESSNDSKSFDSVSSSKQTKSKCGAGAVCVRGESA